MKKIYIVMVESTSEDGNDTEVMGGVFYPDEQTARRAMKAAFRKAKKDLSESDDYIAHNTPGECAISANGQWGKRWVVQDLDLGGKPNRKNG